MHFQIPSEPLTKTWAAREFATLDCSDARRLRRFVRVASDFIQHPGASVPEASKDWAGTKACYRLFDHDEISADSILAAHRDAMLERLRDDGGDDALLVIQDTTSLNFSGREDIEGFGPIGNVSEKKVPGLFVHGQLVVAGDGRIYGLAGAEIYARLIRAQGPGGRDPQPPAD